MEDECGISLRKPNKRFTIKEEDLVTRTEDHLQNVWIVQNLFIKKYDINPPVVKGYQMPLHRNGNASQKTLAFKGLDTFVKENYMLSPERATVFTKTSSNSSIDLKPEFSFKGKGKRTKLNSPSSIKVQWSESDSYRIDQLKQTIMNLPNRFNPFMCNDFVICVLDNYALHIMLEVKKLLWERSYVLIIIGGGITGYVQKNDTHVHRALNREYRHLETELMLSMLQKNNVKIPSPSRDDMMKMIATAWNKLNVDYIRAFKTLFVTNSLDGSKDYLVSDRLFKLNGDSMVSFQKKFIESLIPASLSAVVKKLIPPKGIKRKNQKGFELLDFICPDDAQEDYYQNLFDNLFKSQINFEEESDGKSADSDGSSDEVLQDEGRATQLDESEIAASSSRVVPLSYLCDDPDVNKDALFLISMAKVFEIYTGQIFLSHVYKFQNVCDEARTNVLTANYKL